jgi:hypothetical protein
MLYNLLKSKNTPVVLNIFDTTKEFNRIGMLLNINDQKKCYRNSLKKEKREVVGSIKCKALLYK